jgi:hypothetical protein
MDRKYYIFWWMSQTPYVAEFAGTDAGRESAEAAANVRNALLVIVDKGKITEVVDYYRRDEAGKPIPAEWRDLVGPHHMPWGPANRVEHDPA